MGRHPSRLEKRQVKLYVSYDAFDAVEDKAEEAERPLSWIVERCIRYTMKHADPSVFGILDE